MITVSVSKLKTFSSCPRKYWYSYNTERKKNISAILGTSVHKAIEMGYKGADPVITFSETWQKELEDGTVVADARKFRDGLEMLKIFDFSNPPLESEVEFRLPYLTTRAVYDEFTGEQLQAPQTLVEFHGFIDQIYPGEIRDLKTSTRKPHQGVLNNDLQFIMYAWAYRELYGELPQRIVWHHLRTGELIEADVFKDFDVKVERAAQIIAQLPLTEDGFVSKDAKDFPLCVGEACMFCSYRLECLGVE